MCKLLPWLLQARLDALEDGGADDVLAGDDVDEEFNMDDEMDDVEVTGAGSGSRTLHKLPTCL